MRKRRIIMEIYRSSQDITKDAVLAQQRHCFSFSVVPGETYGFIARYNLPERACINVGEHLELPWQGVEMPRYRVMARSSVGTVKISFLGYISDGSRQKGDIILAEQSRSYEAGSIYFYVEGIILKTYRGRVVQDPWTFKDGENGKILLADEPSQRLETKEFIELSIYKAKGYEAEQYEGKQVISLDIMPGLIDTNQDFFLDLWQHPCSWARVYDVPYFSDAHFHIIESYLKDLAALGQKVTDLVVSDFPWAGQACFQVKDNPARLYEYNIVRVKRDKRNHLILDFTALDRYVALCEQYGMADEIDVFGLIGLWHGRDFGSPLQDYRDPIRLMVYDERTEAYDFLRTKIEVKAYIRQLFDHFASKGYLDRVKVIGDEPGNMDNFNEFSSFLNSCTPYTITYKYAIHNKEFFEAYTGSLENFSISTLLAAEYCQDGQWIGRLKEAVQDMTWYPCWFPKKLNTFISSPFAESRLIGVYTYLFRMKGMLRWAYGLYVEDVFSNPVYKPERWPVGDMFLVYPGKDGHPLHSVRERNLYYGIQDFNRFMTMEKTDTTLWYRLRYDLQIRKVLMLHDGDIEIDDIPMETYETVRAALYEEYINDRKQGLTVAWTDTIDSPIYQDSLALRKAVFLYELGGTEAVEIAHEEACQNVVLYCRNQVAATARLYSHIEGVVQLQRIAIAKPLRGKGWGRRLLRELESRAFCEGYHTFKIAARKKAIPFYEQCGYTIQSEPYVRDGVEHCWMTKPSGQ